LASKLKTSSRSKTLKNKKFYFLQHPTAGKEHNMQHALHLYVAAAALITGTYSINVPNPDVTIDFDNGVPISTPSNVNGDPFSIGSGGGSISTQIGPDQLNKDAIDTEIGGYAEVLMASSTPEAGCTYMGDPCVCLLRCPNGQSRYGDGSACRGGSQSNCDLGYCHSNPNPYSPCVQSTGKIPLPAAVSFFLRGTHSYR
jgi:hypothetical protein